VLEALEDDLDLDRPLRVAVPPARVLREGDGAAQSAAERLLGGLGHLGFTIGLLGIPLGLL